MGSADRDKVGMNTLTVHTSTLFDPKKKRFVSSRSITVDPATGLITSIFVRDDAARPLPDPLPANAVDLRGKFVMPGLVNAHTNILSRADEDQEGPESVPERIIRAVNRCRAALLSGYTTYRDLGSEFTDGFDINLRDAVARELALGPRLLVAGRPLASASSSSHRKENGTSRYCSPPGAETLDGVDEIRESIRRRIAAGPDVIKVYADYKKTPLLRLAPESPGRKEQHPYTAGILHLLEKPDRDYLVFSQDEMDAIVFEARRARCPVAARCCTLEGAMAAIKAGVRSIEHGYGIGGREGLLRAMAEKCVILVPTLACVERTQGHRLKALLAQTKRAFDLGVRIACGGEGVRELELMRECGISVENILESCMLGGWESCGGELCGKRFGWMENGAQADIIALDEDPRLDIGALRRVSFVMKDARIWKMDGLAVGML